MSRMGCSIFEGLVVTAFAADRTLVYIEGDASMRKFEKDGKVESALSIVQRKFSAFSLAPMLRAIADRYLYVLQKNWRFSSGLIQRPTAWSRHRRCGDAWRLESGSGKGGKWKWGGGLGENTV